MSLTNKFLENIKKHRASPRPEKFSGFLADYLKLVEGTPHISSLAHKRLYTQIMSHGLEILDETNPRCRKLFDGDAVKIYNYFEKQHIPFCHYMQQKQLKRRDI